MRIVSHPQELQAAGQVVCGAIGVFDGVHLGHQEVIRLMRADARKLGALTVAITFDRHPRSVVAPEQAPGLIHPLDQKLRALEQQGVDAALVLPFTPDFARQTATQFVDFLTRAFDRLASLSVGRNFFFGYQRQGNVEFLRHCGQRTGFIVNIVEAVHAAGQPVSSSRIRRAIAEGDLETASRMLGRPYSLLARVRRGDGLGAQLGFPTANLVVDGLQLPPDGVYAARVRLATNVEYRAVINLGMRPTLNSPQPARQFEVHLLEFSGDLYEAMIEVAPGRRLRPERKFPSLEDLKEQIRKDVEEVRSSKL